MASHVASVASVGLSVLGSLFIFARLFTKPPFDNIPGKVLPSCAYSKDVLGFPVRDMVCIAEWFFTEAVTDQRGTALLFLIFLLWAPLSLWWTEQGGKLGHSPIFSPIVFILIAELGVHVGLGPLSALTLPVLYAVFKSFGSGKGGIAPPASAFYTFTNFGLHQVGLGLVLGLIGIDVKQYSETWHQIFHVVLVFPFILLPLQFIPARKPKKDDVPRSTNIFDFLTLVLVPSWWADIAYIFYIMAKEGSELKPAALFLAWDCLGVFLATFSIYTLDYVAGDAKGLPSFLIDVVWAGPPAAASRYFAAKERQGAKRANVLKKTK